MTQRTTMKLIPALLLVAFSGAASAAAFQLWEQNASGLGTAYAGSAAAWSRFPPSHRSTPHLR